MRWIGIDYGDTRIGIALSEPLQIITKPYITLKNNSDFFVKLESIVNEKEVKIIVVGYPYGMKGQITKQTEKVDLFIDRNFISEDSDDWNLQCHFDSYFDTSYDVPNGIPREDKDIVFYHERLEEFNSNHSWVKHSYSDNSVQKHWYKYYNTPESSMVYSLENMTRLMWYLESKKIDYKFFCGWNIFRETRLEKIPREPFDIRFLWNIFYIDCLFFF